jgi:hypothetical protein
MPKRDFEHEVLERLTRIEERQLQHVELPKRINDLETRADRQDGFVWGAKWVFAAFAAAVSYGFIKLGIGDAVANTAQEIVRK